MKMAVRTLSTGTRINSRQFVKWMEALRSNKYGQIGGKLQDHSGSCCLGVACAVLIPKAKLGLTNNGKIAGGMPKDQYYAPPWLQELSDDFLTRTTTNGLNRAANQIGITFLNDSLNMSFQEIADVLEAVYIYGVLE